MTLSDLPRSFVSLPFTPEEFEAFVALKRREVLPPGVKLIIGQIPDNGMVRADVRFVREGEESRATLGALSRKFEVGGRGPGTISPPSGDIGGISYGSYQMKSLPDGATVKDFLTAEGARFAPRFEGHAPGSAGFSAAWRALATEENEALAEAEHAYIRRTHYEPQAKIFAALFKVAPVQRSAALRDVIWSTAVHHGGTNTVLQKIAEKLTGLTPKKQDFDERIIRAVYAERGRKENGILVRFKSSPPDIQASVADRFRRELADALAMLAAEEVGIPDDADHPAEEAGGGGAAPNWIAIGIQELGVRETPGPENTARIGEYFAASIVAKPLPDSESWCGAFVAFCLTQAGAIKPGTGAVEARAWSDWGAKLDEPRLGCVVVTEPLAAGSTGHVGFWVGQDGSNVLLLSGNAGDVVGILPFARSKIRADGLRWPEGIAG